MSENQPEPDAWDALTIDELFAECRRLRWSCSLHVYGSGGAEANFSLDHAGSYAEADTPRDALLMAMRTRRAEHASTRGQA